MVRTIVWFIYFWWHLFTLQPSLCRIKALDKAGNIVERDALVSNKAKGWARSLVSLSGCKVEVTGEEHIPEDEAVLFVSNHQGNFDIPILLGFIKKPKAFVAKNELRKFPIIGTWMKYMNCIFMDRDNPRESIKAINHGAKILKEGYSLVIFPEGTRSKDGTLGVFKPGAFKLATKSGVCIVPVTIKGSNQIMKKGSFIIKPAEVEVVISPAIKMEQGLDKDTKALAENVRNIISENLC